MNAVLNDSLKLKQKNILLRAAGGKVGFHLENIYYVILN